MEPSPPPRIPPAEPPSSVRTSVSAQAYAALAFTMACWAGNTVAAKLAVGEVSPMVIISARWGIVAVLLAGLVGPQLRRAWPELRRHWKRVLAMGLLGFSVFNALFYVAAHHTTGVNIAILQGGVPVLVVLGTVVFYGARVSLLQAVGIAITLVGVAAVASQGSLATLLALRLNPGDALLLIGCLLQAGYTLLLRYRPNVSSLALFSALAAIAFLTSLPLLAFEIATGTALWPSVEGWAIVLSIAIFPSFLAQLTYLRGVQLIGPGRAGLFNNLVPIFGALFAVALLGERFAPYHLLGLLLVIGGILVAETAGRTTARMSASDGS
jgi:drug/metabolite transporter (DMT)-like permease